MNSFFLAVQEKAAGTANPVVKAVDSGKSLLDLVKEVIALKGLDILAAIAIIIIGWIVARILRNILSTILTRSKVEPTLASFVSSLSFVAVMSFVIIAALHKLGMQTASLVAAIGAMGLAVGLALQGSLANFAAGILIIIFKPIKVGDYVEAAGDSGIVKEIEIFTTTLTKLDNRTVIIPNAKLTGDNIINYSTQPIRRVDLTVGVSYGDDLDKTTEVIMDVLKSDERILTEPAPKVAVCELGDSSVNFVVRPWVKSSDYWDVYFDITKAVKQRLDSEDITIPFPQRDVHIYNEDNKA